MSFEDFYDIDEIQAIARFCYRRRFASMANSSCPIMNEEDAVQSAVIHCWKKHTQYDPSRGATKSTWLFFIIRNHYLDRLKAARVPMRYCENLIGLPTEVGEDLRIVSDGKTTKPKLTPEQRDRRVRLMQEYLDAGMTTKQVARIFDLTEAVVCRYLKGSKI